MKVTAKDIAPAISKVGGQAAPEWVNKIDEIVKGVNQMFENYYKLTGKTPPGQPLQITPVSTPGLRFQRLGKLRKRKWQAKQNHYRKGKQKWIILRNYYPGLSRALIRSKL